MLVQDDAVAIGARDAIWRQAGDRRRVLEADWARGD